MWPGIKTETGLPEAPSGGQPGFLSFSTAYTSTQPGHLHYSYPSQGKLQLHSVSQDNAITLSANRRNTQKWRRTCSVTALFSSLVASHFKYCVEIFLFSLSISRLKLHNIQCVLQHPFGYGCHHNLHHSGPPGNEYVECK